jgi:hypothetical protein
MDWRSARAKVGENPVTSALAANAARQRLGCSRWPYAFALDHTHGVQTIVTFFAARVIMAGHADGRSFRPRAKQGARRARRRDHFSPGRERRTVRSRRRARLQRRHGPQARCAPSAESLAIDTDVLMSATAPPSCGCRGSKLRIPRWRRAPDRWYEDRPQRAPIGARDTAKIIRCRRSASDLGAPRLARVRISFVSTPDGHAVMRHAARAGVEVLDPGGVISAAVARQLH